MRDAKDLAQYIEDHGIAANIVFLKEHTPTVEAAAAAVGVHPRQILKSLLFIVKSGDEVMRPVLVIANGLTRVDYKKLASLLGVSRRQVRIANPEQVEAITGYVVGTVPPFGHADRLPAVMEAQVLNEQDVYGGGGAINALVKLSVAELQRVVDADIASLI